MKNIYFLLLFISTCISAQSSDIFDLARKGSLQDITAAYNKNPEIVNSINKNGSSMLILACYRNNQEVALFLADKVKDINYNSGQGTALMAAVMAGNLKVTERLIALKADFDQKDKNGKTALIYATFFNKNEIARKLIESGAAIYVTDNDGKKALDYAVFNKNTELIILLDK